MMRELQCFQRIGRLTADVVKMVKNLRSTAPCAVKEYLNAEGAELGRESNHLSLPLAVLE